MRDNFIQGNYSFTSLNPGELVVTNEPKTIWTVLGSCVAVILYHRESKLTGVCHAQMPDRQNHDHFCADSCPHPCCDLQPESNQFKFVSCSIEYMLHQFQKKNIEAKQITARVVGGSTNDNFEHSSLNIGKRNIETALNLLDQYQIKIIKKDLGGKRKRTIKFFIHEDRLEIKHTQENGS